MISINFSVKSEQYHVVLKMHPVEVNPNAHYGSNGITSIRILIRKYDDNEAIS